MERSGELETKDNIISLRSYGISILIYSLLNLGVYIWINSHAFYIIIASVFFLFSMIYFLNSNMVKTDSEERKEEEKRNPFMAKEKKEGICPHCTRIMGKPKCIEISRHNVTIGNNTFSNTIVTYMYICPSCKMILGFSNSTE